MMVIFETETILAPILDVEGQRNGGGVKGKAAGALETHKLQDDAATQEGERPPTRFPNREGGEKRD